MNASDDKNRTGSTRPLSPQAQRALIEADKRREKHDKQDAQRPTEIYGRKGPEPTRYDDWEKNGIISDF